MRDYKQSKSYFPLLILLVFVIGIVIGVGSLYWNQSGLDLEKVEKVFAQDQDYQYFYQKLSQSEQAIYQRIYYACHEYQEEVPLETTNIEEVKTIFEKVLYDHPEFYYINSQFQYFKNRQTIKFLPKYDYSQTEVVEFNQQLETKTKTFITETKKMTSPLQQARLVYQYMIENVVYQENKKTDQNILSSLLEGKSVCAGYARGYQYLANRLGLKSVYIVGTAQESNQQTASGDGHAWVMLQMDGDYYYCDPTWGDVVAGDINHTCYGYFMMSSDEMLACYQPEVDYEKTQKENVSYFLDEKCYMESYDEKVLSYAVKKGLNDKTRVAEVKCGSERVYQQVKAKLESSYLGYRVLNQNGCWSDKATYSCHDELKLIELYY